MTRSTGRRRHHFKSVIPTDPAITPLATWPTPNRSFHHAFYYWLKAGGYARTTLDLYSVSARLALGYLNKLHWTIDPDQDIELVRDYIKRRYTNPSTRSEYNKGLLKLVEYLRLRQNKAGRLPAIRWEHYLNGLPDWLCEHAREFIAHKQKSWRAEDRHRGAMGILSPLCQMLRWMAGNIALNKISDITPQVWFDYLDVRMLAGISLTTINIQLFELKSFLHFLDETGQPICERTLLVEAMKSGRRIPKDAPVSQLRGILLEVEKEASAEHASRRRLGTLDRAWIQLMLYSGLRTCEVRRLRLGDIDWENRRIRIEQSKGLKDRLVCVNSAAVNALRAWLEARGDAEYLSDHVFVYCHGQMGRRYCQNRLRTYGKRCAVQITPHQLRHSCATLLLNAGAPVLSVQSLLGHEKVDTTLGYARLYDGTIAADYYRAMAGIEQLFALPAEYSKSETGRLPLSTPAELVALLDSLSRGTLNELQREMLHSLRQGILSLAG
jgi:site-specific recombinase XerD